MRDGTFATTASPLLHALLIFAHLTLELLHLLTEVLAIATEILLRVRRHAGEATIGLARLIGRHHALGERDTDLRFLAAGDDGEGHDIAFFLAANEGHQLLHVHELLIGEFDEDVVRLDACSLRGRVRHDLIDHQTEAIRQAKLAAKLDGHLTREDAHVGDGFLLRRGTLVREKGAVFGYCRRLRSIRGTWCIRLLGGEGGGAGG